MREHKKFRDDIIIMMRYIKHCVLKHHCLIQQALRFQTVTLNSVWDDKND